MRLSVFLKFFIAVLILNFFFPTSSIAYILKNDPPPVTYPNWRASPSMNDCDGPVDWNNRHWYEKYFDDRDWQVVSLPLINDINPSEDRYYRTTYTPPQNFKNVFLNLASDDGIWIYINGNFVGNWGANSCHGAGCVGDVPWTCNVHKNWVSIDISDYLIHGQPNIIAAHVTNYALHGANWSYFSLTFSPNELRFDLPIYYENRDVPYEERDTTVRLAFYKQFQHQVTAVFDHSPAKDGFLQPYTGEKINSNRCVSVGITCYDGHKGWDFDDKPSSNKATIETVPREQVVYPVAEGDIVPEKTGWFNDGFGYRVCMKHGNTGYSTLYGHLRKDSFETWGHFVKDQPIGVIGSTGHSTGTHLHFGTFYSHQGSCEFGTEVDPSGWLPAFTDPNESATGIKSIPLWIHPLSSSTLYTPGKSVTLSWHDGVTQVTIPTNAYSTQMQMSIALAPDPSVSSLLAGVGESYYLFATDSLGNEISQLDSPMTIQMSYSNSELTDIWPDTIGIFQYDVAQELWVRLPTTMDSLYQGSTIIHKLFARTKNIAPIAILGTRKVGVYLPIVIDKYSVEEKPTPTVTPTITPRPTNTPTPFPDRFIWWEEAENGRLIHPIGLQNDKDVSNCQYIYTVDDWSEGGVELSFTLPESGNYYIWARAMGLDWHSNSFWISIDNGTDYHFEILPRDDDRWGWEWKPAPPPDEYEEAVWLSAGTHSMRFKSRENAARLDAVLITDDPDYIPTEFRECR